MWCLLRPLRYIFAIFLATGIVSLFHQPAYGQTVRVFAAASLKTALDEAIAAFSGTGDVTASYASSAVLARQIAQGAPAALFISANVAWMDHLDDAGLIEPESRRDILGNRLVLVSSRHSETLHTWSDWHKRLGRGRLALAQYDAAPAGIYAKEALTDLGLWDATKPAIIQTDNVRSALAFAATGAVDYAIVYASDAMADPRVTIVATLPSTSHSEIRYPAAIVSAGRSAEATMFLQFLSSTEVGAIFQENGFELLQDKP